MKRIACLLFIFSIVTFRSSGSDLKYPVKEIVDSLKKNADCVLRDEEIFIEVVAIDEVHIHHRYALTIMNEKGDDFANFSEYYGRFSKIESAEGYLYNEEGKELLKARKKQMQDLSAVSGMNLIDDTRQLSHSFYHNIYPYTVEYNVEIVNTSTFSLPAWIPQGAPRLSVQNSKLKVSFPSINPIRYLNFDCGIADSSGSDAAQKILSWTVSNLRAMEEEPYSPEWELHSRRIILAPESFMLENYEGSMKSWDSFGKFIAFLNKDRFTLPENIKKSVHEIADSISDPKEKVKALYQFMQKNTRYVSIQLGIGGWQPLTADFVGTHGYGDCKALSNYMYSILREAGIKSNYTLIRAGRSAPALLPDFVSQQFNHVILFVPFEQDTIWLECTSQSLPAGYLSSFTSDRYALSINESESKLVRTPPYTSEQNTQTRFTSATLQEDGSLLTEIQTKYTGVKQDKVHFQINYNSKDKIKEALNKSIDLPSYDVVNFEYIEEKNALPQISEKLNLLVHNYSSQSGKRIFIVPNICTRFSERVADDSLRTFEICINEAFSESDSVIIQTPEGFSAESIPSLALIRTDFGEYTYSVSFSKNQLLLERTLQIYGGIYPASQFRSLQKFYNEVFSSDRAKVVLTKK